MRENLIGKRCLSCVCIVYGLLGSATTSAQSINKQQTYLDAVELANIVHAIPVSTSKTIYDISSYEEAFRKIVTKYDDVQALRENPFLDGYLLGISFNAYPQQQQLGSVKENNGKFGLKFEDAPYTPTASAHAVMRGPSWQASAINSLSGFVAQRFSQESMQLAVNHVIRDVGFGKDTVLVKYLFPKSYRHIQNFYSEDARTYYSTDIQLLRMAAQMDLDDLSVNVIDHAKVIFPQFSSDHALNDMLTVGSFLVEHSAYGVPMDKLLSDLANESFSDETPIHTILQVADLIAQSLLNRQGSGEVWVDPIRALDKPIGGGQNLEVLYYYGLLYTQLMDIPEMRDYLTLQNPDDIILLTDRMFDMVSFVQKLNESYAHLRTKEFTLTTADEVRGYVDDTYGALNEFFIDMQEVPGLHVSDAALEVPGKYFAIAEAAIDHNHEQAIPMLLIEFGEYMSAYHASFRSVMFLSELAMCASGSEMETVLNAYALPIGSSSIKRNSALNISVNSYVGFTAGRETAFASKANLASGNVGLSAPVGLAVTWRSGSVTTFISMIDLGSIVNQRFNSDSAFYSDLRLEQFFTPGIGLFWNLRQLPISAGLHLNYIPNLRTIEYRTGNTLITENYVSVSRLNVSVLMDIPLVTLYHRDK